VDCKILHGQRFNRLSEADQGFYLKLWILAVRERTACFPVTSYGTLWVSHEVHVRHRRCKTALSNLAHLKLIELLPDGSIIINDVMDCHEKLKWEQVHLTDISCTFPGTSSVPKEGGEIRVLENRDKNPDSGAEIVTQPKPDPSSNELSQDRDEDPEPWNSTANSRT